LQSRKEIITAFVKEVGLTKAGASNLLSKSEKNPLKTPQNHNQLRWWDIEKGKPDNRSSLYSFLKYQSQSTGQIPNHENNAHTIR